MLTLSKPHCFRRQLDFFTEISSPVQAMVTSKTARVTEVLVLNYRFFCPSTVSFYHFTILSEHQDSSLYDTKADPHTRLPVFLKYFKEGFMQFQTVSIPFVFPQKELTSMAAGLHLSGLGMCPLHFCLFI